MKFWTEEIQRVGDAAGLKGKFMVDYGTDDIINVLHELRGIYPTEYEEREVKRWIVLDANYEPMSIFMEKPTCPEEYIVELTGTYTVPVPRKERKRLCVGQYRDLAAYPHDIPRDANLFAEWDE